MKAWLVAAVAVGALLTAAGAPARAAGRLTVSDPRASLILRGPMRISGTAPVDLGELPGGSYRLQIRGPGLAESRGTLLRSGVSTISLSAAYGPSTVLLPPGLAYLGNGEGGRGFTFLASGFAFAAGAGVEELGRLSAEDDLEAAQRRYDAAAAPQDVVEARADLLGASDRVADRKEMRDLWLGLTGALWLGSAIEAWIMTPAPSLDGGAGRDATLTAPRASGAGAGIRSAVFPGAGQRYLGHSGRGNRFTAGIAVLAATTLIAHDGYLDRRAEQRDAQRRYDLALTAGDAERRRREVLAAEDDTADWDRVRWALAGAAGAVYLWNILDAAFLDDGSNGGPGFTLDLRPGRDGVRAGLAWRVG
jgi:hypothetical protein